MCPGVESDQPGACPKCGMALERNPAFSKDKVGTLYTCPMHPEVRQDHPGACPICGMALEPVQAAPAEDDTELRDMLLRFKIGIGAWVCRCSSWRWERILPGLDAIPPKVSAWIQFVLSTPVVLWCGWPFFERGARSIATRNLNMFTLIALGTGAAYAFSVFALFFPGCCRTASRTMRGAPVYFEAASFIIVLVLLGQVLELRARAPEPEKRFVPCLGWRRSSPIGCEDGREEDVPLEVVRQGMCFELNPARRFRWMESSRWTIGGR